MLKLLWLLLLGVLLHVSLVMGSYVSIERRGRHEDDCEDKEEKTTKSVWTSTTTKATPASTTTILITTPTSDNNNSLNKNICVHACDDSPCKHMCKDGPCHQTCIIPPPLYEPQVIAAAVLLMVIGLYLMAIGFPFFIVTMAMIGFLIGSSVTYVCLHAVEPKDGYPLPSTFYLGCCIGGGLFLAVGSLFCWKVTIYLLCGSAGYLLSLYIWTWKEDFILKDILVRNIIGLSLGFIFILGFVLIEFATVILSLSFIGAYVFILGLDLFIKSGFLIGLKNLLDFNKHLNKNDIYIDASTKELEDQVTLFYAKYKMDIKVYGMMCAVFGLWIISTVWQRYYNKGNRFGLRVIRNSNDTLEDKLTTKK